MRSYDDWVAGDSYSEWVDSGDTAHDRWAHRQEEERISRTASSELLTLTEALRELGYTHRAAKFHGQRSILDADGVVVFTGRWDHVRAWLREGRP